MGGCWKSYFGKSDHWPFLAPSYMQLDTYYEAALLYFQLLVIVSNEN